MTTEELETLIDQANRLLVQNPQETFEKAQIILVAATGRYPLIQARALRTRAMASGAMGNFDACALDFQEAIAIAESHGDLLLKSQALHGLSNVHFYRGEFALALERINAANALRRQIGDEGGLMTGLNTLGALLSPMGDFQTATNCFFESLEIARRMGSLLNEALALTNIGCMKLESGQAEKAIFYLEESQRVAESANSRIYQPFTLVTLANAFRECQRFDEAQAAAEKSLSISRETGNHVHEVSSMEALALIAIDRKEYAPAEETLLQAIPIAETNHAKHIASLYTALGILYIRTGNRVKAEEALCCGLEKANSLGFKKEICEIHRLYSELYASFGDFEAAYRSHLQFHEHHRALERESLRHRLEAQQSQLEMRRAQEEAERQRKQKEELAEVNRENEKLLERIREQAKQLAELAITDPLTGLYNRRYLRDYLAHQTEALQQGTRWLAIALLDLDNFKLINDRLSHDIGDVVLKRVARFLENNVRNEDIVIRFGGEEFLVILPGLTRNEASGICETLRRTIAGFDWHSIHPELQVTTSIGLADTTEQAAAREGMEFYYERFLLLADTRLYQAKATGKNRVL